MRGLGVVAACVGLAACNGQTTDGFSSADTIEASGTKILRDFNGTAFPLRQHTAAITITSSGPGGTVDVADGDGSPANIVTGSSQDLNTRDFGSFNGFDIGSVSGSDTVGIMTLQTARATYTGYGVWKAEPNIGPTVITGFHYGLETPESALPTRGGTATYVGPAIAIYFAQGATGTRRIREYTGVASLEVNFHIAADAVTGSIRDLTSGTSSVQDLLLTGTRSGSSFAGEVAPDTGSVGAGNSFDPTARGVFSGQLYGPRFEEAGASGSISDSGGTLVFGFGGD